MCCPLVCWARTALETSRWCYYLCYSNLHANFTNMSQGRVTDLNTPGSSAELGPFYLLSLIMSVPRKRAWKTFFFSHNIPAKRSTTKVVFLLPFLFSRLYSSQHHWKNTFAQYTLNKHPFWKIFSAARPDWYQPVGQRKLNREGCVSVCVCMCREGKWILLCSCPQGSAEILKKMKTSVSEGFFPLSMPPCLTTANIQIFKYT